jgi:ATP-dependent DNA helicase UvrD/PcrA
MVTAVLGRGVVVAPGAPAPEPWVGCRRVVVDPAALADPSAVVADLHGAWLGRAPVVVELGVGTEELRTAERWTGPVHDLGPDFTFFRERLQFLVWANNYDGRPGDVGTPAGPVWWHGRKAARRWARQGVTEGGPADVVLADGSPLFVDGGPGQPPELPGGVAVVHRWNAESGSSRPAGHAGPTAELAPDQRAAVAHRGGPTRVVAPAGSGKTRVLTERLRHLVADRGVDPGAVTALAFNTRAAGELRERCADFVTPSGPTIRTLNSLGLWICNELGGAGRLDVLDEPGARAAVQQVYEVRRQANADTVAPFLEGLSAIRLGLVRPAAAAARFPDAGGLAEGFDRYRALLADAGAVDFDEQIYRAVEILLADPEARAVAQRRCRYLLVDEFQDLTPAHVLLLRLLSAPGFDCFGVGDDDQVIYGYAGADPVFLLDYDRFFPGATGHALEVSYRCPPAVVDAARHLLSYNHRRVDKTIRSARAVDGKAVPADALTVHRAPADRLAGATTALLEAWRDEGVDPGDMAVLARVNSALLPVQLACAEAGLPTTAPVGPEVLRRTGVRTALAYLRIGLDPGRIAPSDFAETVRRPSRGIAPKVVEMVTRRPETSVADIRRLAAWLTGKDAPKLEAYARDVDRLAPACRQSTADALRTIRLEIGLGDTMDVLDSSRGDVDRSSHADDLAALESVAVLHPEVETFERWLRTALAHPPEHPGSRVLLSTVHRIKGREWDRVVVFGATTGQFPHRLSDDEEGERRVFHVAITRGRERVAVMAAEEAPSIFVAELDGSRPHAPAGTRGTDGGAAPAAGRRASKPATGRPGRRPTAGRTPVEVTIPAAVGLSFEHGGHLGEIVELSPTGAVQKVGGARVLVAFGSPVRVDGRTVTLVGPEPPPAVVAAAEESLRSWRKEVAAREKVPAYIVFNDRELSGIAHRAPRTLAELAGCSGVGPIKLERWGDEVLAVLDAATGAAAGAAPGAP